jgi:hypothetical protein
MSDSKSVELGSEREELISEIRAAFHGISRGNGVTLHEARAIDDYKSEEERKQARELDHDKSWDEIPDADIKHYHDVFSFFDVEGFRYHLPAYMIWAVRYFDVSESCSSDNVIYVLSRSRILAERDAQVFNSFDLAQCRAICRFLKFMASNPMFADADAANLALDEHWSRFY